MLTTRRPISRQARIDALSRLESKVASEVFERQELTDQGLGLLSGKTSMLLPQVPGKAKGTVVMLHGFTAGSYQYREMADEFHREGYNVYVPRLPGHGVKELSSGKTTGKLVPGSTQDQQWHEFSDEVFADAQSLGDPVYAVGLSGGANLALNMAKRNPEVKGVVAMAPYVGADAPSGWLFSGLSALDTISFGLLGRALDKIRLPANKVPSKPTPPTAGQALTLYQVGARAQDIEAPTQLVSTQGDRLSGRHKNEKLFGKLGGSEENGWFHFPNKGEVPHAMVSRLENSNEASVKQVEEITMRFIDEAQFSRSS